MSDGLDALRQRLDALVAIVDRLSQRQVEAEGLLVQAVEVLTALARQGAVAAALDERSEGAMLH